MDAIQRFTTGNSKQRQLSQSTRNHSKMSKQTDSRKNSRVASDQKRSSNLQTAGGFALNEPAKQIRNHLDAAEINEMAQHSDINEHSTKLTMHREVRNTSVNDNAGAKSTIDVDALNYDSIDERFKDVRAPGKPKNLSHLDRYATTKTSSRGVQSTNQRRILNMNLANTLDANARVTSNQLPKIMHGNFSISRPQNNNLDLNLMNNYARDSMTEASMNARKIPMSSKSRGESPSMASMVKSKKFSKQFDNQAGF